MIILAIETSCDDTSVAVVKVKGKKNPRFEILSNVISSQTKIHQQYGGVYPFMAKREHQKNLPIVFKKALRQAQGKPDLIAVTEGPGLEPCLWVGINFAEKLAKELKLPLVPANHIESHILANWLAPQNKNIFPAIGLVVSGGHTQLILMEGLLKYKIIGETRDDAAGECLDKVARILGLGYPGGPAIAKTATGFKKKNPDLEINMPRPMINQKNYDFSFSGLKTAVLYDFKNRPEKIKKSKEYIAEMSSEIQQAVIDVLLKKTFKAAKEFKAKSIILGGGVSSNLELRKQFKAESEYLKINFLVPPKEFCTDNAVMTAITAFYHLPEKDAGLSKSIEANANLRL